LLTKPIIPEAIWRLPVIWGSGVPVEIDDEIIDFTQKGGWRKIDSADPLHKRNYRLLLKQLDVLTEGVKVGIDDFS
jgi:hypothetical protein